MLFNRLNPDNALFEKLADTPPSWWKSLVADKDLYVEVRKNNTLDVYYNGGAVIKGLKYSSKTNFEGEIHFEYIPLVSPTPYIPFDFKEDDVLIDKGKIKILDLDNFSGRALMKIKKRIAGFFGKESEKGIQAAFRRNDPYYIDSEIAYQKKSGLKDEFLEEGELRIDLVRIDRKLNKIVFVELKKIDDKRLYSDEIVSQLSKYSKFLETYDADLLEYYKKVFAIKKRLNLLTAELRGLGSLDDFSIAKKPLLLFGDCNQTWIDKFSGSIDHKIRGVALGGYYFGKPEYLSDIVPKRVKNRHVFSS